MIKQETYRISRISKEIRKSITIILKNNIRDPRIKMVTVSNIEVSSDIAYAKVFVTFLNVYTPKKIKNKIQILQKSCNFIRRLLSKFINLRIIPSLTFFYDTSIIESNRIFQLIRKVIKNDKLNNSDII